MPKYLTDVTYLRKFPDNIEFNDEFLIKANENVKIFYQKSAKRIF